MVCVSTATSNWEQWTVCIMVWLSTLASMTFLQGTQVLFNEAFARLASDLLHPQASLIPRTGNEATVPFVLI